MKNKIISLSNDIYTEVLSNYKHLHQHPELSYQEFETSKFVQNKLKEMRIGYKTGLGGNGVLGKIEGRNPNKRVIALRADMDALPIVEDTGLTYASVNKGVMHACGHDAHTSSLLGAANILNQIKNEFEGTVLLVFQPGEERAPGGAKLMLEDGVFDELKPEIVLGQHVSEDYPTGSLAFRGGIIMASADEVYIKIKGKGGHAAKPNLYTDTVLAAAQTLVSLQQVASRLCPPLIPMVLSFGKLEALGATNVIPDEVNISGTFRTYDEKWRKEAKEHIRRIVNDTTTAYACTAEVEMPPGYPSLNNNQQINDKLLDFAKELIGEENTMELDQRLTAEDFAFFSQKYPSCFFRFGTKGESNKDAGRSHTSKFQIDEKALLTGMQGMAWFAYKLLSE